MRLSRLTTALSGTAVLGCAFLGTAAFGQCTISNNTNYVQNDGGCPVTGVNDLNGGCNAGNAFQATGALSTSNTSFTIRGTVGADAVLGSRDLDWYSFDVVDGCFVNISCSMTDPAGVPATNNILLFKGKFNVDGTPDCASPVGFQFAACPANYAEFFATPGKYMVIVTTNFANATTAGLPCNSPYNITVSARFSQFASCGSPAGGDCSVATPSVGGCQDAGCCDTICTANPLCCDIAWDASCVAQATQPVSAGGCGIFLYTCPAATGAPANNCAVSPQTVALGSPTAFNNAAATTDGPNNGQCGSNTLKDVWFLTQAPANGNMTLNCTSPNQDVVLSVYGLGTSSTVVGQELVNNFIGCLDNAGAGGEIVTLTGCVGGEYYLWRVGQWDLDTTGAAGAGSVTISFERVVWSTGNHAAICNAGTTTGVNLGLSSGAIAATSPQRWLAAPFVVTDPDGSGPQTQWNITTLVPEGFTAAGTPTSMNWIVFTRNGSNKPNYATDQVASGQVAYPTLGANGETYMTVNLNLPAGTYYMTAFPSAAGNPCRASDGQATITNWAWFVGAPNGLAFNNGTSWYQWRSAVQPGSGPATEVVIAGTTTPCSGNTAAAGFVLYNALNGVYDNCSGVLDQRVYSPAFAILGSPVAAATPCPADLNGDRVVGPADLSTLLNNWGGSGTGDINGDGTVGAADLASLLSAWGTCP